MDQNNGELRMKLEDMKEKQTVKVVDDKSYYKNYLGKVEQIVEGSPLPILVVFDEYNRTFFKPEELDLVKEK